MKVTLTLTSDQYEQLRQHLYPGDGLEAIAFIACGRAAGVERHRLVAKSLFLVPHEQCDRATNYVKWNATEEIESLIEQAEVEKLSLIKVHSHTQGFARFSEVDDASDSELLPTIRSWVEADVPHGSAIMLPDGEMFGRYLWRGDLLIPLDGINVVGHSLQFWWKKSDSEAASAFGKSHDQAFGEGTTRQLQKLSIAVVGASGTGSPLI